MGYNTTDNVEATFSSFQVSDPYLWFVVSTCIALIPPCLNMTLECQYTSSLRRKNTAALSDRVLSYAKGGSRQFPGVLNVHLWREIWNQRWGFRSWIGLFSAIHLFVTAGFFSAGGGTINYKQGTIPYFVIVILAALYAMGMFQHALIMHYSTRKVHTWIAPCHNPKHQIMILYESYIQGRWKLFCSSCFANIGLLGFQFVTGVRMVYAIRTQFVLVTLALLTSTILEFRRFKALYRSLSVVHPIKVQNSTQESTRKDDSNVAVQKRNAKQTVLLTVVMSLVFIITLIAMLLVILSPYSITTGRFNNYVNVFWFGFGTFMYYLQLWYHIRGTRKKLKKERNLYLNRQEQAEKTTLSTIRSVNPNASHLFA